MRDINEMTDEEKKQIGDLVDKFAADLAAIYDHKFDIAIACHPDHPEGTDCLGCIILAQDTLAPKNVHTILGQAEMTMRMILYSPDEPGINAVPFGDKLH